MKPEPQPIKLPAYAKASLVTLLLALLVLTLYLAGSILYPLFFAALFAVLLLPVEEWLRRYRVPQLLAIALTVLLGVGTLLGGLYFLGVQVGDLASQLPALKTKLLLAQQQLAVWLDVRLGISNQRLAGWVQQGTSGATALLGRALATATGLVEVAVLVPVYAFFLLLYRERLVRFINEVFSVGQRPTTGVQEVLHESRVAIQSYMVGLLIEGAIVGALNILGLVLLGIPYALLLGVAGALLNVIPYVGGVVGLALPVLIAFITKDSYLYPLGVVGVYTVIQFIDNHILVPRIVAGKVQVNALAAMVGVLVGNALGGISGMFLAVPIMAILKIVFERVEGLRPWATLLGDADRPSRVPIQQTVVGKIAAAVE